MNRSDAALAADRARADRTLVETPSEDTGRARRRADTPHPYPGLTVDRLTPDQADEVQVALAEQHYGRAARAQWDEVFWRGGLSATPFVRTRVWREIQETRQTRRPGRPARTGSQRGSPEWHK